VITVFQHVSNPFERDSRGIEPLCPTLLDMERIIIQELDRTLRRTREGILSYSDEGLLQISKLIESASLAVALESYSREVEALRAQQSVLV